MKNQCFDIVLNASESMFVSSFKEKEYISPTKSLGRLFLGYFKKHLKQKDIFNMLWNNNIFLAYSKYMFNIFSKGIVETLYIHIIKF